MTTTDTKSFIVGCSYGSFRKDWTIKVIDRTDTTLTFDFLGETQTREIKHYAGGTEYIKDGDYQFAVTWNADDPA